MKVDRTKLFVARDESVVSESSLEEVELYSIRIVKLEMLHTSWERLDLGYIETRPDDGCSKVLDVLTFESEMVGKAPWFVRFISERHKEF
jgi:hypothetical protein